MKNILLVFIGISGVVLIMLSGLDKNAPGVLLLLPFFFIGEPWCKFFSKKSRNNYVVLKKLLIFYLFRKTKQSGWEIMRSKKKNILTLAVIGIIGFMVYDFFSVKLHELNGTGELIDSFSSQNGQYTAKSFLIDDGGATVASRVRVSITSSKNNEKENFNDETVYWGYRESDADIKWLDDHTLIINDRKIDILNEETYYNWKDYLQ